MSLMHVACFSRLTCRLMSEPDSHDLIRVDND